jgi:hypothetical protein
MIPESALFQSAPDLLERIMGLQPGATGRAGRDGRGVLLADRIADAATSSRAAAKLASSSSRASPVTRPGATGFGSEHDGAEAFKQRAVRLHARCERGVAFGEGRAKRFRVGVARAGDFGGLRETVPGKGGFFVHNGTSDTGCPTLARPRW